jgi:hypothetical protein
MNTIRSLLILAKSIFRKIEQNQQLHKEGTKHCRKFQQLLFVDPQFDLSLDNNDDFHEFGLNWTLMNFDSSAIDSNVGDGDEEDADNSDEVEGDDDDDDDDDKSSSSNDLSESNVETTTMNDEDFNFRSTSRASSSSSPINQPKVRKGEGELRCESYLGYIDLIRALLIAKALPSNFFLRDFDDPIKAKYEHLFIM